ncbi:Phage integrase family protein [Variovorax sp. SRS16]|uniref:tyrosine-type recombinase/integrase n=1 Tax=Variovorax sp. SRS16 TaxID=282217 RepID=UPI001316373E|nr:integrase family protein [Variovorax sp. SRS16]VTU31027.1 Phage integrase family protein [Variovorax sp. SRS16]
MARLPLTAARVEALACAPGKSQSIHWDSKAPGLGLRITEAGARSYIFESRLFGKTIRVTIGNVHTWDLGRARTEAARLKTLIDGGIDPREHRAEQQAAHEARRVAAKHQEVTFGEAWDVYLEARKKFWSSRHYSDHLKNSDAGGKPRKRGKGLTEPGSLASLRPLRLPEITGDRVAQWMIQEATNRPTVAALAYRQLRAFIRWAAEHKEYGGLIPSDAYGARDVKDAVPRVKAREGDVLQREQLPAWFAAVRCLPNRVHSVYLQALLLTGARREEMAAVRWTGDVDLQWRSLTLDDKVEGTGGRVIPLTPYLTSLLEELKRLNEIPPSRRRLTTLAARGQTWEPSPWVFPSLTSEDGKLAEPRAAHVKALEAAALPHLSLHGLRRSFGTLSEWVEVPVGVVAQIQGHKPSAIAEKHYRRRPLDLLRKWHDQIEAWVLNEAGVAFPLKHAH